MLLDEVMSQARRGMQRSVTLWERCLAIVQRPKLVQRIVTMRGWRLALVLVFLVGFAAPLITAGGVAYSQYSQLKAWGLDGVQQLMAIKDLLPSSNSVAASATPGATGTLGTPAATPTLTGTPAAGQTQSGLQDKAKDILNKDTLTQIKQHCEAAKNDFAHINAAIANRDGIIGIALGTPYRGKILATQQMAIIGLDAAALGSKLATVGMDFTNTFETSPFSPDGGPLLTQKSFADVQQALLDTQATLLDIQVHLEQLNVNDLPVNNAQRAQLNKYLPYVPKALKDIAAIQPLVPLAGWALGVDTSRQYLIQTMDRAELRPSGGFNGAYGILNVTGGRLGKISLTDVDLLYPLGGKRAPEPYYWWPFGNFGLRDSNLSGDFPTTAKLSEYWYHDVTNVNVDGVIMFSPTVIEHLLGPDVLGPLTLSCYNDVITSTNLEDKLHYYQLGGGVEIQKKCSSNDTATSKRKRFTAALASALQDKVRASSQAILLKVVASAKNDLATKELEVYMNNPAIEAQLSKNHVDAAMIRDPKVDSTYIVQANVSVNKGAKYVTTTVNEHVWLKSNGDAYHDLTVSLDYQPHGNVYGQLTYRDYVRVYTAPNAQYLYGSGFDQNIKQIQYPNQQPTPVPPLCNIFNGAPPTPLPTPVPNPDPSQPPIPYTYSATPCQPAQAPTCTASASNPTGLFIPGGSSEWITGLGGSLSDHIDDIGAPTTLVSDEPGRGMFGGLIVVPAFCKATFEIAWMVPHSAGTGAQHNQPYTFAMERQSGTANDVTIDIEPSSDAKIAPIKQHFTLNANMTWTLNATKK